jgi:hypothetical protein
MGQGKNGHTFIYAPTPDGSGPETMIEFAVLDNHPAISQADIVII